jgi:hypothetical protein
MAQIDPAAQQQTVTGSALQAKYGIAVDRESAYERLTAKLAPAAAPTAMPTAAPTAPPPPTPESAPEPAPKPAAKPKPKDRGTQDTVVESVLKSSAFKSFTRSAASALGREITRGLFGTRKR